MTPSDVTNEIIQVLGSPAWSGAWTTIGITISSTISIIALKRSRQTHTTPAQKHTPLKKFYDLERIFRIYFSYQIKIR